MDNVDKRSVTGCDEYKFLIRMNIQIYSYQENDTNEYLNVFVSKKIIPTNIRIYWYQKNDTNEYPNIFVSKKLYERISEYIRIKKTIRTNI